MSQKRPFPIHMITLLLKSVRRVWNEEGRLIVAAEFGGDVARTVRGDCAARQVGEMSYLEWELGGVTYHIGTCSVPYISVTGEGKVDEDGVVREIRWRMREEVPPEGEAHGAAWMSHAAWLYVDALAYRCPPAESAVHYVNVLRVAARLIDDRCVLIWQPRWNEDPKRVALPTERTVASLRAGVWPGTQD